MTYARSKNDLCIVNKSVINHDNIKQISKQYGSKNLNRQDLYRHKLLLLVLVKQKIHCESVCHLKDNSNIFAIKSLV